MTRIETTPASFLRRLAAGALTGALLGLAAVPALVADGLVEAGADRLVLTRRGRLLADAVVRDLLP